MSGTTGDWLAHRARRQPEAPALLLSDGVLSYRQLEARVAALSGWLAQAGVEAGARLAVLLPPSLAYVALVHAALRLRLAIVPLNHRLTPYELAELLRASRPLLFLHDGSEKARAVLSLVGNLSALAIDPADPPAGPARAPQLRYPLADIAAILFTSGTTGRPKGAMLSRGNLFYSALLSAENLGHLPGDRWLIVLPLFHVGGLSILFRAVLFGASVLLLERFDEERVLAALQGGGVTLASFVAVMLHRILAAAGTSRIPHQLRAALLGGGPIPPDLLTAAHMRGLPVVPTYGLTETASQVVTLSPDEAASRPGVAGRPLFLTEVRVVGEDGRPLPPGMPGEIIVSGPTVFQGYFRDPAATAAALREGWLHTGDIGVLDADGYLRVLDRRSDLIVTGGENVYPAEVEAALEAHPAVAEAGVYGLPDPVWGQQVAAWVVLRPGLQAEPEELLSFLRARLAAYKLPRRIRFASRLPRTASGKLRRHRLADWTEEG